MKNLLKCFILLFFVFQGFLIKAQFQRTYGGAADDQGAVLNILPDGSIVIMGSTRSFGAGDQDAMLLRIDANGNQIYCRALGTSGFEHGYAMDLNPNNGRLYGGILNSNLHDHQIYEINPINGASVTTNGFPRRIDVSGGYSRQLSFLSNGNILTMGYSGGGFGHTDIGLIEITTNGVIVNEVLYGGSEREFPHKFISKQNGGRLVVGATENPQYVGYVVNVGQNLQFLTGTRFSIQSNPSSYIAFLGIEARSNNEFGVIGHTFFQPDSTFSGNNIIFCRVDSNGSLIPNSGRIIGGLGEDIGWEIKVTSTGYLILGTTSSFGHGQGDISIIALDFNGNFQWARAYGGSGNEIVTPTGGMRMRANLNGGHVIVGGTNSWGSGGYDVYFLSLDSLNTTGGDSCEMDFIPRIVPVNLITDFFGAETRTNWSNFRDSMIVNTDTLQELAPCGSICFADNNPIFPFEVGTTTYNSQYITWPHKVFVTGTVSVTGNSTLDISESDVVFGPQGRIIFQGDAVARFNNSVFRPCNYGSTWSGIEFLGSSSGQILSCEIKNAVTAIRITGTASVKISNNDFIDNLQSVVISQVPNSFYNEAITGNHFSLQYNHPDFNTLTFVGILLEGVFMQGLITQNEFSYQYKDARVGGADQFTGIFARNSSFTAVGNEFANVFRCFDVTGSVKLVTIEGNKIDYSTGNYGITRAIRITNVSSGMVLVDNNEIAFTTQTSSSVPGEAIYIESCRNVFVIRNEISGFQTGISIEGSVAPSIAVSIEENVISRPFVPTSGSSYGIFVNNCLSNLNIRRNAIRMNLVSDTATSTTGIYIGYSSNSRFWLPATMQISDNCVYDCSIALLLNKNGGALFSTAALPRTIRNNFFYNYNRRGIMSFNFVGSIGQSCLGYPANVGRNSFVSNFLSTPSPFGNAIDIDYSGPGTYPQITSVGNSNALRVNLSTVLVDAGCNTVSTPFCSNQVGNQESEKTSSKSTIFELVDAFLLETYPLIKEFGEYQLDQASFQLGLNSGEISENQLIGLLSILSQNKNSSEVDNLIQKINSASSLSVQTKSYLSISYHLLMNSTVEALGEMDRFSPETVDLNEWKQYWTLSLKLAIDNNQGKGLTSDDNYFLQNMDCRRGEFAAVARDFTQAHYGRNDYLFAGKPIVILPETEKRNIETIDGEFLELFPNPATTLVSIKFNLGSITEPKIVITDVQGREVISRTIADYSGIVELDIQSLISGVYFVSAIGKEGKIRSAKLIKL